MPAGVVSVAIVVSDPDAPSGTFYHWIVLGLSPGIRELAEGTPLPAAARQGHNSAGKSGYTPVCPPSGAPAHHYHFTVYGLKEADGLAADVTGAEAVPKLQQLALVTAEVVGTYRR